MCVCVLWCSKSWHKLVSYVVELPSSESCQGLYRVKVGWGCSLLALQRLLLVSVRRSKEKRRRRRKRHTTVGRSLRSSTPLVVVVSTMPRVRPISLDTLLPKWRAIFHFSVACSGVVLEGSADPLDFGKSKKLSHKNAIKNELFENWGQIGLSDPPDFLSLRRPWTSSSTTHHDIDLC